MTRKPISLAPMPPVLRSGGVAAARALVAAADRRVAEAVRRATPPEAMASAPVAPARGTMQLVPNWEVTRGGIKREAGAHWRVACALVSMNERARLRAEARGVDLVLPFSSSQIAIADDYRAITEWRDGSGLKCASIEAVRGGSGGSGLFIDTFVERGRWLRRLHARIGTDAALSPRYAMDRGNARKVIWVRGLVDAVILEGQDLSAILKRHGWQADGKNRNALKSCLCSALDRMQGYRDD
ncbi:hypothetical protein [Pseudotabrizicola algicola]|uniref:Uncharacterized protein n=1 Tax=Pseudotabrizicola algicola TaxID=2709381 RepID=A0A6B3RJ31_9RHOB|nr:hypothetical protein [Pseudotabrizicola algicola]NEX45196.1 hypothetical protein [Pseudotabrizicola algicola]